MFAALTIGNTVGPQVYLASEAPQYPTGLYVDIGCWCVLELLIIWMGFYLARLNRSQEAKRVALGLPADIKDMSIMSTAEADAYKVELAEMMRRAGMDYGKATEGSFDDLTDVSSLYRYTCATKTDIFSAKTRTSSTSCKSSVRSWAEEGCIRSYSM